MGLRRILTVEESALHKVCKPVTEFDSKLHKLLEDMRETLIDSGGVGLAAPQVGILRRVVLVDNGEEILELVNLHNCCSYVRIYLKRIILCSIYQVRNPCSKLKSEQKESENFEIL